MSSGERQDRAGVALTLVAAPDQFASWAEWTAELDAVHQAVAAIQAEAPLSFRRLADAVGFPLDGI